MELFPPTSSYKLFLFKLNYVKALNKKVNVRNVNKYMKGASLVKKDETFMKQHGPFRIQDVKHNSKTW